MKSFVSAAIAIVAATLFLSCKSRTYNDAAKQNSSAAFKEERNGSKLVGIYVAVPSNSVTVRATISADKKASVKTESSINVPNVCIYGNEFQSDNLVRKIGLQQALTVPYIQERLLALVPATSDNKLQYPAPVDAYQYLMSLNGSKKAYEEQYGFATGVGAGIGAFFGGMAIYATFGAAAPVVVPLIAGGIGASASVVSRSSLGKAKYDAGQEIAKGLDNVKRDGSENVKDFYVSSTKDTQELGASMSLTGRFFQDAVNVLHSEQKTKAIFNKTDSVALRYDAEKGLPTEPCPGNFDKALSTFSVLGASAQLDPLKETFEKLEAESKPMQDKLAKAEQKLISDLEEAKRTPDPTDDRVAEEKLVQLPMQDGKIVFPVEDPAGDRQNSAVGAGAEKATRVPELAWKGTCSLPHESKGSAFVLEVFQKDRKFVVANITLLYMRGKQVGPAKGIPYSEIQIEESRSGKLRIKLPDTKQISEGAFFILPEPYFFLNNRRNFDIVFEFRDRPALSEILQCRYNLNAF